MREAALGHGVYVSARGGSGVVTFAAARAPKNLVNHAARERQQHLIKSNFLRGDS